MCSKKYIFYIKKPIFTKFFYLFYIKTDRKKLKKSVKIGQKWGKIANTRRSVR